MRLSDRVKYGVRYSENVEKMKMNFLLKLNINLITVSLECFSENFLSQLNDKSLRKTFKMGNPFIPLFDPPNTTHLYFLFVVHCHLPIVNFHLSLIPCCYHLLLFPFTFHFSLVTFHFSLFTGRYPFAILESWALSQNSEKGEYVVSINFCFEKPINNNSSLSSVRLYLFII